MKSGIRDLDRVTRSEHPCRCGRVGILVTRSIGLSFATADSPAADDPVYKSQCPCGHLVMAVARFNEEVLLDEWASPLREPDA